MKKLYYVVFIAVLYVFSQAFQEYIVMYGALQAVAVGLVIAFVCKHLFKMVTNTIITIAVIAGIGYFLVTTGYIELPLEMMENVSELLELLP